MIWILVATIGPLRKEPKSRIHLALEWAQIPISLSPRLQEPVSTRILRRGGGRFSERIR